MGSTRTPPKSKPSTSPKPRPAPIVFNSLGFWKPTRRPIAFNKLKHKYQTTASPAPDNNQQPTVSASELGRLPTEREPVWISPASAIGAASPEPEPVWISPAFSGVSPKPQPGWIGPPATMSTVSQESLPGLLGTLFASLSVAEDEAAPPTTGPPADSAARPWYIIGPVMTTAKDESGATKPAGEGTTGPAQAPVTAPGLTFASSSEASTPPTYVTSGYAATAFASASSASAPSSASTSETTRPSLSFARPPAIPQFNKYGFWKPEKRPYHSVLQKLKQKYRKTTPAPQPSSPPGTPSKISYINQDFHPDRLHLGTRPFGFKRRPLGGRRGRSERSTNDPASDTTAELLASVGRSLHAAPDDARAAEAAARSFRGQFRRRAQRRQFSGRCVTECWLGTVGILGSVGGLAALTLPVYALLVASLASSGSSSASSSSSSSSSSGSSGIPGLVLFDPVPVVPPVPFVVLPDEVQPPAPPVPTGPPGALPPSGPPGALPPSGPPGAPAPPGAPGDDASGAPAPPPGASGDDASGAPAPPPGASGDDASGAPAPLPGASDDEVSGAPSPAPPLDPQFGAVELEEEEEEYDDQQQDDGFFFPEDGFEDSETAEAPTAPQGPPGHFHDKPGTPTKPVDPDSTSGVLGENFGVDVTDCHNFKLCILHSRTPETNKGVTYIFVCITEVTII
ncbi:flocculation protein FLO11-like [Pollicipes pollicipes]|uniref:flocculation protein FLO11-like n=1 Tax=Pollicipes pollicipes TaxID=41117 RepID=UPI00188557DD|nr:flocculation protein FLO11-like [Pollicipes pollicipes]